MKVRTMQVSGSSSARFLIFPTLSGQRNASVSNSPASSAPSQELRSNKRDILFDAFTASKSKAASVEASGPLALFRSADAVQFLASRVDSKPTPIADNLDKSSRFQDLKASQLGEVKTSLQKLQTRVSELRDADALNTRSGKSTKSDVVEVNAGKDSPEGTFSVQTKQLAKPHVLVSDAQTTPLGALGVSGSFFINGSKIAVESTNSIFDIRNKINFGEDQNQNGVLDGAEDINNNNVLETITLQGSEFGAGVFIQEDLNGNGALDASEDANNNQRLDGGVDDTKVIANVRDNRLVFTSTAGSDTKIDLRDDDNILLGLGFFEGDRKGNPVLKERDFDTRNPPVNLIQNPQRAKIEVDGQEVTSTTNTFTNAIADTTLTVKQVSQRKAQIQITFDAAEAVSQIQSLFSQFNDSVGALNNILAEARTFQGDPGIQKIRNALTGEPQEKVRELSERNETIDAVLGPKENQRLIGIEVRNTAKDNVEAEAVTSTAQKLKSGMTLAFKNQEQDLLNQLTSIGIRTLEDDTFAVDADKLKRALEINAEEVSDLFNDSEKGILPVLDKKLSQILASDLEGVDPTRPETSLGSPTSNRVARQLRQFAENSTQTQTVQTLISVA